MTRIWASICIFIALVAFIISNMFIVDNLTENITAKIDLCENSIRTGNFIEAKMHLNNAIQAIEDSGLYFGMVIKHSELDEVFIQAKGAEASFDIGDIEAMLPKLAEIKARLMHISRMEKPAIENIL